MTPPRLEELIKLKIDAGAPFDELVALLRAYRDAGATREEATASLNGLLADYRKIGADEEEEVVMGLLDLVTGWCHPSRRIWEKAPPG